jgi:hypothetical protein
VFGALKKVEIKEALTNPAFVQDLEFIELYEDYFRQEAASKPQLKTAYSFCACRSNHIVGIIKD